MPRFQTKKRKFYGNRHSNSHNIVETESEVRPIPSVTSSAEKKLEGKLDSYNKFDALDGNIIVSFKILCSVFSSFVVCKECGSNVYIEEVKERRNGLACRLVLKCTHEDCHFSHEFSTSNSVDKNNTFDINLRLFYGLRCIGKGPEAGKTLCGMLNLPSPCTYITKYTNALRQTLATVTENCMKTATLEAIDENKDDEDSNKVITDIPIAFDGTWQKRGFVSKNACCTVTSVDTGKVLDVEVLTKYCSGCEKIKGNDCKKATHEPNCLKNYDGNSGGMESAAAVAVCQRSIPKRGVRYVKFLGDGDSKAHLAVVEDNPYGDDTPVEKLECIGHISKRMGTRLRKLKKSLGGKPLSDGKSIKGPGRLTDKVIDKFQSYYGNAIRANVNDLDKMKRAVWSTFFHYISTDEVPSHQLCPPAPETWCKYNKAMYEKKIFKHKSSVPLAVMEAVKPTFQALAQPSLLKKCLHGKTQNVNEFFNNIVWSRIPKNVFVGRKTLEIGVFDAILTFNDGNLGRLQVLKGLGISDCGINTVEALKKADDIRLHKAHRAAQEATKEARIARRRKRLELDEIDDTQYFPGGF